MIATATLVAAVVVATAPAPARADAPPGFTRVTAQAMGTRFEVVAWVATPGQRDAVRAALDEIGRLEARWSPWVEGSEIARVNAAAGHQAVTVEADTLELVARSLRWCRATGGAFDPTFFALAPLYPLADAAAFVPPTAAQLAAALRLVDCAQVTIDRARSRVRLGRPGMRLHLGGNAKGTALDAAAGVLEAAGIDRFVVDGGGDIVVRGEGPGGPWRVGIQDPRAPKGTVIGRVRSSGGAVATSGDYERFLVVDGRRYHHIIDPRTGAPASGCRSATVALPAGPHAAERADTWATALCVLGATEGLALLARHAPRAQAAIIDAAGAVHVTEGFDGWVEGAPPTAARQAP